MKLLSFLPWRTLAIAAAVLVVAAAPGASHLLSYERPAIQSGELWRTITGHLVHTSGYHLLWNLLGLIGVGLLFEEVLRNRLWTVLGVSALTVGFGLLLFEPGLPVYCGLSGVLNGLWVGGALSAARAERRRERHGLAGLYLACVVGDLAKTAIESLHGAPLFTDAEALRGAPVPLAHALGALGGVIGLHLRECRLLAQFRLPLGQAVEASTVAGCGRS